MDFFPGVVVVTVVASVEVSSFPPIIGLKKVEIYGETAVNTEGP